MSKKWASLWRGESVNWQREQKKWGGLWLATLLVLIMVPAVAVATGGAESEAVARWPLILASVGLGALGLMWLGVKQGWHELSAGGRVRRGLGVTAIALAIFGSLYGLTETPPGSEPVEWVESYEEGEELAREMGRPVMVDFMADWCVACHELDGEVFRHPEVRQRLESEFIPVKIDYDARTKDSERAIERFEVSGLPRVAFETPEGDFLRGPSFEGKVEIDDFHRRLDQALAGEDGSGGGWLEDTLGERGILALLLIVFGAGILASLSPCIYPLIPVTIGVLGAREASTRREGFVLSLAYVGGMVVTYSVLGVVASMVGGVFGSFFHHAWLQATIATVFVVLGLGCLGVYDLRLPGWVQKRLGQVGGKGYSGAFAMGLGAGILAVPCVGPVVAGILVYVAQQGDVVMGWSLLTVFAMGMGLLFLVVGTFSSLIQRLPRAGGWMEGVKAIFGAIFIGLGIYYLRLVTPMIGDGMDALWLALGQWWTL